MGNVPRLTKIRKWAGKLEATINGEHLLVAMVSNDDLENYRRYLLEQIEIVDDVYSEQNNPKHGIHEILQPNTLVYKKDTGTGKDPKNTGISMLYMGTLANDPTYAVVALTISRQCDEIKITGASVWSEPHTAVITNIKVSELEPITIEAV